jgi:hypothetical protein
MIYDPIRAEVDALTVHITMNEWSYLLQGLIQRADRGDQS